MVLAHIATIFRRSQVVHASNCLYRLHEVHPGGSSTLSSSDVVPEEIKLRKAAKRLDVRFSDGNKFSFPAELLRVESPSAENERLDAKGLPRVTAGRKFVGILGLEPVGNYAIRIKFDDLHQTGIYTWSFLHELGTHKLSRAKAYIRELRSRGLSREPKRRSKQASQFSSHSHEHNHGHDHAGGPCSGHHHQ
mmetsp:Transcript_34964/g.77755  ORF Transcript_34964/g.77755 Transcript_34964/m.77755 type:complete len:192 (-) Transcript_34964:610-1185(-)